ncbi:SEC-C metal-binding domain-containing protein [Streptomyces graminilatus]|uniref:SEC-C metal-binding domain-containing protein n=1 Tax=Streptomyces graminilatus TaxID=1464070 RepID=UPI0006E278A6|nr:SEC-C metal-binding domain-containing protein [Streptomyces graminilatus]
MTPNPTHRKRLASAVSKATSVPYQRALDAVIQASEAGELPTRLDADGMLQALSLLTERLGGPADTFAEFLDRHQGEPTARQYERWAAGRPDNPEAASALINAGWQHAKDGGHRKALDLFRRAEQIAGTTCRRLALVGQAEQLYRLGDQEPARSVFLALADELAGKEPDADLMSQVCDSLTDLDDPAIGLEWCDRLLAGSDDPLGDGLEAVVIHRQSVRAQLDLEPDELDRLSDELEEQETAFFQSLPHLAREEADRAAVSLTTPNGAYDGLVLIWPDEDVPMVQERWPQLLPRHVDLAEYRHNREHRARQFSDDGVHRVILVPGELSEYERYAAHKGADPALPQTLTAYTQALHAQQPEGESAWPPPRNGPCWCGSGVKYKKCHGGNPTTD